MTDIPPGVGTRSFDELVKMTVLARELAEALASMQVIAEAARAAWEADEDMRVGKVLIALAGPAKGYRADIDTIHATLVKARVAGLIP